MPDEAVSFIKLQRDRKYWDSVAPIVADCEHDVEVMLVSPKPGQAFWAAFGEGVEFHLMVLEGGGLEWVSILLCPRTPEDYEILHGCVVYRAPIQDANEPSEMSFGELINDLNSAGK